MLIVLTRDVNPAKGYIKGAQFDWTRPTITAISGQLGKKADPESKQPKPDTSWYRLDANIDRRVAARSERTERRGGRAPRRKPTLVTV